MSESPPNTITVTLLMDTKHDVRAVRLLLKRLLRAYDLKCVGLAGVSDEQEACPPMVDTINAAKCKAMFDATAGEGDPMSKAKKRDPMRCRFCGSLCTELIEGVCIPCTAQGDAAQRPQQHIRESERMAGIGCVTSRQGRA